MASLRDRFSNAGIILLLLLVSTGLLTLAFAPINQFYLAWIGMAHWLIVLTRVRSQKGAFFWSWVGGTIFFTANMWWMYYISFWGLMALMIFLGLYWAASGVVIRGAKLLDPDRHSPLLAVFAIAAIWVCFEWLRGIIFTGLPWLYLGHSQSHALVLCQIWDLGGAYAVSFWVIAVNSFVTVAWLNRNRLQRIIPAGLAVGGLTLIVLAYGIFRIEQTPKLLAPGPMVAVVQANYPQSNTGTKSVGVMDRLSFHLQETERIIRKESQKIDLVIWSETMMPPINHEALEEEDHQRQPLNGADMPVRDVRETVGQFAAAKKVSILTGGEYEADFKDIPAGGDYYYRIAQNRRNTAYFFDSSGRMDDALGSRYDKIHLVPWGEFIPGKQTMPWLYRLSLALGPQYYSAYELQPGADDAMTVFHLRSSGHDYRFVTPICFEDIEPGICREMFCPRVGGGKRADFLVNITNDGWFKAGENAQHLQAAVFRSIENRAWTARSVNTGISGFIDSTGRTSDLVPVRTGGGSAEQVMIDPRLTFYTRFGDIFAYACIAATVAIAVWAWINRSKRRKVQTA